MASDIEVSFSNKESMKAKIVGYDQLIDVALLKVDADARALTPLELGPSASRSATLWWRSEIHSA